jgi:competence protein ComEC
MSVELQRQEGCPTASLNRPSGTRASAIRSAIGRHWLTVKRRFSMLVVGWQQTFLLRPILPVAVCYTAGVLLARWEWLGLPGSLLLTLAWVLSPWCTAGGWSRAVRTLWLLVGCLLVGAVWYHVRAMVPADDIRHDASPEGRTALLRLRLVELHTVLPRYEPLRSWEKGAYTTGLADVEHLSVAGRWERRSGRVRISFDGPADWLAAGDRVQVLGELIAVMPPGNPGEDAPGFSDYARGLSGRVYVRGPAENCWRMESARWYDLPAQIVRCQRYFYQRLKELLPEEVFGLAVALLLGEMTSVDPQAMQRYLHTGVIHVLAISGQHLVLLAAFVQWLGRFFGKTPRHLTWLVIPLLWSYALLTGARPATLRAAIMVTCWCLGLALTRPTERVNFLCLAWLVIGVWQPQDWFTLGCQLSFLASLVLCTLAETLIRYTHELFRDPWQHLEQFSWSRWLVRAVLLWLRDSCLVSGAIWLVLAPCVAAQVNTVPSASVWLTPLVVPLITVALLAGIALLFTAGVPGIGSCLAWLVAWPLRIADGLLIWAENVPLAYFFTPGPALWWLIGFYLVVLAWMLLPGMDKVWRWVIGWVAVWAVIGWLVSLIPERWNGLRVTFLDVGHGGCVVVEMPDGCTWLYDAGSLSGPDVAERVIAPFLWHRQKRRIDAVLLSHGDLDHYNALPRLAERFRIGAVYVTPTFWEKGGEASRYLQQALERAGAAVYRLDTSVRLVPLSAPASSRTSQPGQEQLAIEILHPPPDGPPGPENARSLVLLLRYGQQQILLTGDLEEPGLSQVLPHLPKPVQVLLAPHHGSPRANTPALAQACRPGLVVVACDRRRTQRAAVYQEFGATVWETWREGAVIIAIDHRGLVAQTYRTGKHWAR